MLRPGTGSTGKTDCGEPTGRGGKQGSLTDWPLSGRALIGRGTVLDVAHSFPAIDWGGEHDATAWHWLDEQDRSE
jgi:hypothetical protein